MTDRYGSRYYSDEEIDELKGRREARATEQPDPNYRGIGAAVPYRGHTLRRLRGYSWQICKGNPEEYSPSFAVAPNYAEAKRVVDDLLAERSE